MKFLTKAIENRFQKVGCQDGKGDEAVVIAKFFCPWNQWTWYATEYDPETRLFFGLVRGHEVELGSFSRDELESVRGRFGLKIERDLHWREKTVGDVRRGIQEGNLSLT